MKLCEIINEVKSGVFHIIFLNKQQKKIGSGSAFLTNDHLITNNHVFSAAINTDCIEVEIRREISPNAKSLKIPSAMFQDSLVTGSEENNFDYAILKIPDLNIMDSYQFTLEAPTNSQVGDEICFLGYPLDHMNIVCHKGIISSIYMQNNVRKIQIDASVNPSNSGGPLIDISTKRVIGIVTRKATGLTKMFDRLRDTIKSDQTSLRTIVGMMSMNGIDIAKINLDNQAYLLQLLDEIERSANVGIGYAFSAEHLMQENLFSKEKIKQ